MTILSLLSRNMAWSVHCKSMLGRGLAGLRRVNDLKVAACSFLMQHRTLSTKFPEFQSNPQLQTHDQIYKFSLENPDQFWSTLARSRLQWSTDFDTIKDCDINEGRIRWFLGGQLNASGILSLQVSNISYTYMYVFLAGFYYIFHM